MASDVGQNGCGIASSTLLRVSLATDLCRQYCISVNSGKKSELARGESGMTLTSVDSWLITVHSAMSANRWPSRVYTLPLLSEAMQYCPCFRPPCFPAIRSNCIFVLQALDCNQLFTCISSCRVLSLTTRYDRVALSPLVPETSSVYTYYTRRTEFH